MVPVIAPIDIYRSANELIKQYGDAADIEAAMRADELMEAGDMEGRAVWLGIVKAIEELLSEDRPGDAEVQFRIADFGLRTRRWMSAYGY